MKERTGLEVTGISDCIQWNQRRAKAEGDRRAFFIEGGVVPANQAGSMSVGIALIMTLERGKTAR